MKNDNTIDPTTDPGPYLSTVEPTQEILRKYRAARMFRVDVWGDGPSSQVKERMYVFGDNIVDKNTAQQFADRCFCYSGATTVEEITIDAVDDDSA